MFSNSAFAIAFAFGFEVRSWFPAKLNKSKLEKKIIK